MTFVAPPRAAPTPGIADAARAALSGNLRTWQGLVVASLATCLSMRLALPTNGDVSWLITICEQVLGGRRLYVDIFEANPPFSVLLYLPLVRLAQAAGLRPEPVIATAVLACACGSILICLRVLRGLLPQPAQRWRLAAGLAFVFLVLPAGDFAEREHIAMLLMAPFISLCVARGLGEDPPLALALIAGLALGVAGDIKPHFALVALPPLLWSAYRRRSVRALFQLECWAALPSILAYAAALWQVFPSFLHDFMPLVRDVYLPARRPLLLLLRLPPVLLSLLLVAGIFLHRVRATWLAPLLGAAAGGAAIFFIQGKGWAYQSYPWMACLVLAALGALAAHRNEPAGRPIARPLIVLSSLGAVVWFAMQVDHTVLRGPVRAVAPHPTMLAIGADLEVGHPLVRDLGGRWVGSQCNQWLTASAVGLERRTGLGRDRRRRLDEAQAFERRLLTGDIRRAHPDVILIEEAGFDWAGWARQDPALAKELRAYTRVAGAAGVGIWRRGSPA